jgi:hypothetical protein
MAYTPNPNRAIKGGKAMVSAQELADFREKFGKDKTLRDLLNMDKGLQRKLEIPKSMRNLPNNESASASNKPLKSVRLPANETDPNLADKTSSIMDTFKIPKETPYKKGGSVSSASSRADGCAVKGKTKGRMV